MMRMARTRRVVQGPIRVVGAGVPLFAAPIRLVFVTEL
jgi:hypothetical protein